MFIKRIVQLLSLFIAFTFCTQAQVTTSSLGGVVKANNKEPLVGATVTATHIPTGTVYSVATRSGGRYNISNMNPGGPYTIKISFVGFSDETRKDIFLSLGEMASEDFNLVDKNAVLTEVTVSGKRGGAIGGKGGSETSIGRDKIANMPAVGRNIQDYLRAVPQARTIGGNEGAISIAGQNNRFNSFYIDGAVNNDAFGLAASGFNGGQTSAAPISLDAIDQLQVMVSPYDAAIGNFVGGGINAITKSGTNEFTGSVWQFTRNENLSGRNPVATLKLGTFDTYERTKLSPFTAKTTGFRLGGPIVKNKLFFFVLGEIQRDKKPQPFNLADYRGTTNTQAGLDGLANYLRTTYNYDPGTYLDNPETIEANRVTAKLDWNINTKTKLSLSYRYNDALRNNVSASSSSTINFFNNGFIFPSTSNSASLELKSAFNKGSSNRLLVTFTGVKDDRGPIGGPFPNVSIFDGTAGTIVFGTEISSTQNLLKQKNISFLDSYRIQAGKNNITIGTDNELTSAYNVFVQRSFGAYTYNSLADFYANAKPRQYRRGFALLDGKVGDDTKSAAEFKTLRVGFFVNDEIKVNDALTLNIGIRADKTEFLTKPIADPFFNDTALAKISQYYDMKGARSGSTGNIPWSISPRLGFTYKANEEGITLRGGLGLFTGRIPLVWPGGIYNNNGLSVGAINSTTAVLANGSNVSFRADPNGQYSPQDFGLNPQRDAKGSMNLIAETFKLPKIFRTSLAVDKKLGSGWTATFEGIITKNINDISYTNVNLLPARFNMAGIDNRQIYDTTASGPTRIDLRSSGTKNPYDNVLVLKNAEGKKGFSYLISASIDKAFKNGFAFNANYTYGSSWVNTEVTSSVNTSQWQFTEAVNGRNNILLSRSDFDMGHHIFATISKRFEYANKHLATTVSLTYNGQSGAPFSYVYLNSPVNDNGRADNNDLIFIPTAAQLQSMVFDVNTVNGVAYTQQQQRDMFESYVQGDKYLRNHRGGYAERNGSRLPFTNILDLKIAQDFNIFLGQNHKRYQFQIAWEVSNFTNMINNDWGKQYFLSNDNFRLLNFRGFVTTNPAAPNLTPRYTFSPVTGTGKPYGLSTSTTPGYSSRWLSQVSIRFNF